MNVLKGRSETRGRTLKSLHQECESVERATQSHETTTKKITYASVNEPLVRTHYPLSLLCGRKTKGTIWGAKPHSEDAECRLE